MRINTLPIAIADLRAFGICNQSTIGNRKSAMNTDSHMKYKRFEDLPVWKDGIELAVSRFALTGKPCFRGHAGTRNQLENAVVSIANNIAEGFERGRLKNYSLSSISRVVPLVKLDRCIV